MAAYGARAKEPVMRPDGHEACGAAKKGDGSPCMRRAGEGTSHVGLGYCSKHGGCTPAHERAAEREIARREVAQFGLPRDVEPSEALLEELRRTAGWVAWLESTVVEAGDSELVREYETDDGSFKSTSPYYELLTAERRHLVAVAAACLKAGVEERRVRVIEQGAAFAAQAIRVVLERLGHRLDDPAVEEAVRSGLRVVDGGAA